MISIAYTKINYDNGNYSSIGIIDPLSTAGLTPIHCGP